MPIPDTPQTREEMYLNAAATGNTSGIPAQPYTRKEQYLDAIARNAGGGSGGGSGGGGVEVYEVTFISTENTYNIVVPICIVDGKTQYNVNLEIAAGAPITIGFPNFGTGPVVVNTKPFIDSISEDVNPETSGNVTVDEYVEKIVISGDGTFTAVGAGET